MAVTTPASPDLTLVEVKDLYGTRYRVRQVELASNRAQLRCFDIEGSPVPASPPFECQTLHRENICRHADTDFVEIEALGDRWTQCGICTREIEARVQALLAPKRVNLS